MTGKLTIQYDRVGDILYLQRCPPYAEQESEELGDDIVARMNPGSGEIEILEILFFFHALRSRRFVLPAGHGRAEARHLAHPSTVRQAGR